MRAAEVVVQEHLPIHTFAREVVLMTQAEPEGAWTTAARFPLGSPAPAGAADTTRATVAP